jgi:DUF971 family protein
MNNQLANKSEEALTNNIQQAIIAAGKKQVKIRRVQKTAIHGIRIRCATDEEAEEVRNMDWKMLPASIIETTYRVVVHGVQIRHRFRERQIRRNRNTFQ